MFERKKFFNRVHGFYGLAEEYYNWKETLIVPSVNSMSVLRLKMNSNNFTTYAIGNCFGVTR
jgi:hypothetical protein